MELYYQSCLKQGVIFSPVLRGLKCQEANRKDQMQPIDVVITGCVAVSRDGGRTGKGAGFADLELGILRQMELVQPDTPIVTTVHPLQIVDGTHLPMMSHDWSLTWIVTPDEVLETQVHRSQPTGLEWDKVRPEQVDTIPVLGKLRKGIGE